MRRWLRISVAVACLSALARPAAADPAAVEGESVVQTICRLIDSSARAQDLPVAFLTRLIWQESNFQAGAVSPAGARGIAQFMPATAGSRGLTDPFDPESAIPKAAALLSELKNQFGNLGLAAAAYNAGAGAVAKYVAGQTELPSETQNYVAIITRHSLDEWRAAGADKLSEASVFPDASCVQIVGKSRRVEPAVFARSSFWAPWGVQLSASFDKGAALRAFHRASATYSTVLAGIKPMIIGGRLQSRGFRPFYRVRAPAQTRADAERLCAKLEKAGGSCVVLRS